MGSQPGSLKWLMWRFDVLAWRRRKALTRLCGATTASVEAAARAEYERMLPEIAAVGRGFLNDALRSTYEYLAFGKALRAAGHADDAIGAFFEASFRDIIGWIPLRLARVGYRLAQGNIARALRRQAASSSDGWRFSFVEGTRAGEYGFDIHDCAVCTVFTRHGARELVPYLCALDDVMSDTLHMGLRRNGTRALGADRCDFRFATGAPGKRLPVVK